MKTSVLALFTCLLSLSGLAQSGGCLPPPPGLVAWWPGDGDANDIAGGNQGILTSGAIATAQGLVGDAFSFDGVDSYVRLPNRLAGQSEGTVECWFKLNTWDWASGSAGVWLWSSTQFLPDSWNSWDAAALGSHTGVGTGELMFGVESPADWQFALSGVVLGTNVWYHAAGTWGSNGVHIYVNGVLKGTNPYTGPIPDVAQYSLIGRSSWPGSVIDGLIDEVSLYNRALSSNEVAAIYAAGTAGKCKPPPALHITPAATIVLVSWSTNAVGFVLEGSTGLRTNQNWTVASGPINVFGDRNVVALDATSESKFFRLHRP
jgi:hypothetical protein